MSIRMTQLVVVVLFWFSAARAQDIAKVRFIEGHVSIQSQNGITKDSLKIDDGVSLKDKIIVDKASHLKLVTIDENEIDVNSDSCLVFDAYQYDPEKNQKNAYLLVEYGTVRSNVHQRYVGANKYLVKTPASISGVRGTDFLVSHDRATSTSEIITLNGEVEVGQEGRRGEILKPVRVRPGFATKAAPGSPPATPLAVPPQRLENLKRTTSRSRAETHAPKNSQFRELKERRRERIRDNQRERSRRQHK